ncbi:MAG: BREX-2 system adenine-specific DNA-methyltransferase PglX [Polyangiaceae bacterium]|nr:BREX-2 system adenine-specific DNA-methyltransferase PglX [Polyangiaceae bacterium]
MASWPAGPVLARGAPPTPLDEAAVELVAQALPDVGPYGVWGPIDVVAPDGLFEIDLVALGHHALYVVEVKAWRGRITADADSWQVGGAERAAPQSVPELLGVVELKARLIKRALQQEDPALARLRVEPLVLLVEQGVELALPPDVRRYVILPGELSRVLQRGDLPGAADELTPDPVGEALGAATRRVLDGLRRQRRPGYGSFQEEVTLLHRALAADLRASMLVPEAPEDPATADTRTERAPGSMERARRRSDELAAAWIISCAFVRALEDHGLLDERRLAGEGAEETERRFVEEYPWGTARDYLVETLQLVSRAPAGHAVLGPAHNPIWEVLPSAEGARALVDFFRQREGGGLRWSFSAEKRLSFIHLYQDLLPELVKRHALLATPAFVARLLLDLALDPALDELGDDRVRVIDPACGSGELLVQAFERLFERSASAAAGADPMARALAALDRVHGIDIVDTAVLVSRIRLALACLGRARAERLTQVKSLPIHVGQADSLLDATATEDPEARTVLGQRYDVVVGNPPYITCKDALLTKAYRERYVSASRQFSLAAPFIERCFQLAVAGGYVAVLSASSFMKRELGRALIEQVLARVELTHVLDTSGAYIPGYGAPTLVLAGRHRAPHSDGVRAVLAKRGEPTAPIRPEEGKVWSSLVAHRDEVGYEDDYIEVVELPRASLALHPWSLGGGSAAELMELLESRSTRRLGAVAASVSIGAITGLDDVFVLPWGVPERLLLEADVTLPLVSGESIRDWSLVSEAAGLAPFERARTQPRAFDPERGWGRFLWRYRSILRARRRFGAPLEGAWWSWLRPPTSSPGAPRLFMPLVSQWNHFAMAPPEASAKRSVNVVELPAAFSDEEQFALLGYLNSSTACFWLKQISHSRSSGGPGQTIGGAIFEFSTIALARLPVPDGVLEPGPFRDDISTLARKLHEGAEALAACEPMHVLAKWDRLSVRSLHLALADAQQRQLKILRRMVCDQEDLDWTVYSACGLSPAELRRAPGSALPEQRPCMWLSEQAPPRLDPGLIEPWTLRRRAHLRDGKLRLLETVANKRPFGVAASLTDPVVDAGEEVDEEASPPPRRPVRRAGRAEAWSRRAREACQAWLLDRIEEVLRAQEAPRGESPGALAARLSAVPGARAVAAVHAGTEDVDFEQLTGALLLGCAVPYLAALRHPEAGLEKRAAWEETWRVQRLQDAGGQAEAPVPPRYEPRDYRDAVTWRLRGRLDVPIERFIAYPHAGAEGTGPMYGWAGWDAGQRAEALRALYEARKREGWGAPRLLPLLAGLLELAPWIEPWQSGAGAAIERMVEQEARSLGVAVEDLRGRRGDHSGGRGRGPGRGPRS